MMFIFSPAFLFILNDYCGIILSGLGKGGNPPARKGQRSRFGIDV